ncbi:MFS transporter [Lactiplantibacillus nangangensis]|uniref:MFS transporter n=1 Tax=Lactiplantibacillus nangangensis TaxID=2559917 RepID=A0ABW1SIG0_9LACO|nr:MFS transporter [Lactiplantibacillus nangangensis]
MLIKQNVNFRHLFAGRLASNCGDSMYMIALSWYILVLTKSTMWVGIFNFAVFSPNVVSFLFGPVIDRYDKRKILIFLELFQALVIGVMTLLLMQPSKNSQPIIICLLAAIASFGSINAYTVQDALIPKLVPAKSLPTAEMYMSFSYNASDYIFNAITGFALKIISYPVILILDIASFIFSARTFSKIISPEQVKFVKHNHQDFRQFCLNLITPFKLLYKSKIVWAICVGSSAINFLFGGLNVYTLLIAKSFGGVTFFGIMSAIGALGTTLGATFLANRCLKRFKIGLAFCLTTLLFGVALVGAFIFNASLELFLTAWLLFFSFLGINQTMQKPILQSNLPAKNIGSVLSCFYTLTVTTIPIGSVFFGYVAKMMDWRIFTLIFGLTTMLLGVVYLLNTKLRQFDLCK